jgi:hypothetical protein
MKENEEQVIKSYKQKYRDEVEVTRNARNDDTKPSAIESNVYHEMTTTAEADPSSPDATTLKVVRGTTRAAQLERSISFAAYDKLFLESWVAGGIPQGQLEGNITPTPEGYWDGIDPHLYHTMTFTPGLF